MFYSSALIAETGQPSMAAIDRPVLAVHQIEVEILHTAGFYLLLKQWAALFLPGEEMGGELIGENVLVPRIGGGQALAQSQFALATEIAMGGVKVVEAGSVKGIYHLAKLRHVRFAVYHRQAHAAKAESAMNFREEFVGHYFAHTVYMGQMQRLVAFDHFCFPSLQFQLFSGINNQASRFICFERSFAAPPNSVFP